MGDKRQLCGELSGTSFEEQRQCDGEREEGAVEIGRSHSGFLRSAC